MQSLGNHPKSVHALVHDLAATRRLPRATYRLQLNSTFTFRDACALVPYLQKLGISDCYVSPLFAARPGSMHGYDICDHGRLNPDLGTKADFDAFSKALQQAGMGLILDVVPNHMGINHSCNTCWMDVLENGPSSIYASYFDIDWYPVNPSLDGKILLPCLGHQYGKVLESGQLRLRYEKGAFFIDYDETHLPVAPATYRLILEPVLEELLRTGEIDSSCLEELHSILTAISYLPPRSELPLEKIWERNREKEIIKRRITSLAIGCPELQAALDTVVQSFNGQVGEPQSFDRLDQLLEKQVYRLAYWRVAAEEINYRRFFDINDLAAIRMEDPQVFQATHQLVFQLLREEIVAGLRIDHPDGLRDPAGYFRQLQKSYLLDRIYTLQGQYPEENIIQEVLARMGRDRAGADGPPSWPLWVVAEKILGDAEPLPSDWAVYGTTGYDFLNAVNGLFVDGAAEEKLDALYSRFTGKQLDFTQMLIAGQRLILRESMSSELNALGHQLDRISERNRHYRDFTLNTLTLAIREVIAGLFIYRTYITGPQQVAERDRRFIEEAVETARRENPRLPEAVLSFVRDTLLLRNLTSFHEKDRPQVLNWVLKFQQLTGPVIAKAMEDTVFYVYNRLVSLNEVGGKPHLLGTTPASFHQQNVERWRHWPHAMLATSTHDTKRSEDVRARINLLSEIPDEWEMVLQRWAQMNAARKSLVGSRPAPDCNDEYLLYQTLLGAWPPEAMSASGFAEFRERIAGYMHKATKEAKVHTSWINPDEEYDGAVRSFVFRLLPDDASDPFRKEVEGLKDRLELYGYLSSLAQAVLKMTCPGVPDFYQGSELWDFSLVDPDNRRPVDYRRRQEALAELEARIGTGAQELGPLVRQLLANLSDGRIKLYVIYRTLGFRRQQERLFREGCYLPLEARGGCSCHIVALARAAVGQNIVVAVPRFVLRLGGGQGRLPLGSAVWRDTWLPLTQEITARSFRNLYTGEVLTAQDYQGQAALPAAEIFRNFPVALLFSE